MNMIAGLLYLSILGALFVVIPVMVGIYVYRDANTRGMNAALWTLIAVLAPTFIGLIIYLIVRVEQTALQCPNCKGPVTEQHVNCPKCGAPLKNKCSKCNQALEASWEICPSCGEPVPEGLKVPQVIIKKDKGLGKILLAVILIPLLIVILLIMGLFSFRGTNSSSISSADGMRIDDFAGNKVVTDWLNNSDAQGKGIYVLAHQEVATAGISGTKYSYIFYRKGLTSLVDVSVEGASKGLFTNSALKIKYTDTGTIPTSNYNLYQVGYFTSDAPKLMVYVNGNKVDFIQTTTNEPLPTNDLFPSNNHATKLFEERIDYLGDNSGVQRLIEATGLSQVGKYTIELKTSMEPYGLRIIYATNTKEFGISDFSSNAIELLGLIKNLDYVEITDGKQTYTLTAKEASKTLGFDVKELGRSKDKLEEYYNSLID